MSMENFFNWMSKPVPKDEVIIWFNVHNMNYEKIELFGDIFKSLNQIVLDTYMGDDIKETKISMTLEDKELHFEWCWKKTIDNFGKENLKFFYKGEHFEHFKSFFDEVFYKQKEDKIRKQIKSFFEDLFDLKKPFTKSDLDMLTDLYKSLDKNLKK
jgi:hypothetical protein